MRIPEAMLRESLRVESRVEPKLENPWPESPYWSWLWKAIAEREEALKPEPRTLWGG